jgi:urease subunit alpha
MFGSFGAATARTAITFLSDAAMSAGVPARLGLKKIVRAVSNCRRIGKKDMRHNSATPNIEVDPETYEVRVDGKVITCEPATVLPLAQRYFLF